MINDTHTLKGHFIVECLDKDKNVIDRFENHNLIMDAARVAMAQMTAGLNSSSQIDKFVLGTKGHVGTDYLTVKSESDGFIGSRTELFSEEANAYYYDISFDVPGTANGLCNIISETDTTMPSLVSIAYTDKTVEYTFEIYEENANGTGVNVFTEAALYAGGNIFSMKCFPGKIKDNTVSLKIVWKIMF